ncbi:DNA recombination protein RmuC [Populibacterium corticicola]|uniref:DNA recombination protein RmuC n=1 Tax=Populibacterium corticicola TaxID=1812826 RepID=A0ABW5XFW9_9MICO
MEIALLVIQLVTLVLLALVWQKSGGSKSDDPATARILEMLQSSGQDVQSGLSAQRTELTQNLSIQSQSLDARIQGLATALSEEQRKFTEGRITAERSLREETSKTIQGLTEMFRAHAKESSERQDTFKEQMTARFELLKAANEEKLEHVRIAVGEKLQTTLSESLEKNSKSIELLNERNAKKHAELQELLTVELTKLREGNEAKLEKMRETVDEKLQGTLEKRLGESFQLVSTRLEEVHKGLGEMQTLASDVGGLKRVLTNVKSRGGWGEVQLARQLEDLLTPEQYESNVAIKPSSSERVEFAVKLPGKDHNDKPVFLPIDSKFPQEDYERLLIAAEQGDKEQVELAGQALERAIIAQAKTINSKYIDPPHSTDFAIMYLPTEGLFAEAVRRPGLVSKLQNEYRINITGPTTLSSLLNSLQMGFRTLAIEKRSSEVWEVLGQAKKEFLKYGEVWDKLEKQLSTAQNTVKEAGVRTRAIGRKLRDVETIAEAVVDEAPLLEDVLSDLVGDDSSA